MSVNINIRDSIENLCVSLAEDSLLVQGAGGNVSWKDKETLWIKASGTWLSEAKNKDIFVPTDLAFIKDAVQRGNFEVKPSAINESKLRPSIETILHAIMPHKVVVHLHAIEVLSHLVRNDCEKKLKELLSDDFNYEIVEYCKPGSDLAKKVNEKINLNKKVDIIFLMNHGLVIGANDSKEVTKVLSNLIKRMKNNISPNFYQNNFKRNNDIIEIFKNYEYFPSSEQRLHNLAINKDLIRLVESKWALFPDHVVFLGGKALVMGFNELIDFLDESNQHRPGFIFCKDVGTFQFKNVSNAQIDQLCCYYDVVIRQKDYEKIVCLSDKNINELLYWDAEKYRLSISK